MLRGSELVHKSQSFIRTIAAESLNRYLIEMQYRNSDLAFCFVTLAMFPLAAVLWRFSFHDSHGLIAIVFAEAGISLSLLSFAVLPVWLIIHAARNQRRTAVQFLYLETGLLIAWLGTGIYFWIR